MKEITVFDPAELSVRLACDLAGGLRMIADALEAGQMEGRLLQCEGNGFLQTSWRDARAHVLVKLDLAAEVRRVVRAPEAPQLEAGAKEIWP